MRVVSWEEFVSARGAFAPMAAAIGVFDGIHLGHRELIGRLQGKAGLLKGVVTFRENPKRILRPSGFHGDLSTLAQKLEMLRSLGIDVCVLIDFSGDFSKLAGRKFLSLLRESGDLRYLAVGSDFRCGHRLDTGAEEIREYGRTAGIDAELLSPVLWSGHPVSSSRIRKAIAERRLEDAKAMLGRSYEIDLRGAPVLGYRDGELEISTDGRQALPPDGLYESIARGAGGEVDARARLDKGIWSLATAEGLEPRALRLLS